MTLRVGVITSPLSMQVVVAVATMVVEELLLSSMQVVVATLTMVVGCHHRCWWPCHQH